MSQEIPSYSINAILSDRRIYVEVEFWLLLLWWCDDDDVGDGGCQERV